MYVERVDRVRLKPALWRSVVAVGGEVDARTYGVVWERLRHAHENRTGGRPVTTHAHLVRVMDRGVIVPGRPTLVPVPEVYVVHGSQAWVPPSLCELSRKALVLWGDEAARFLWTRLDTSSAESRRLRFQMR